MWWCKVVEFWWDDNVVRFGIIVGLVVGRMIKLFTMGRSNMSGETKINLLKPMYTNSYNGELV